MGCIYTLAENRMYNCDQAFEAGLEKQFLCLMILPSKQLNIVPQIHRAYVFSPVNEPSLVWFVGVVSGTGFSPVKASVFGDVRLVNTMVKCSKMILSSV